MHTKIIKIGNSKGLRLSKTILEKYDIQDVVKAQPFKEMNNNGDDELLIVDSFEEGANWE